MTESQRRFLQNCALSVAGLVIAVGVMEFLLQSYGLFLDHQRNQLPPDVEKKIRILALGESTTDPLSAPDRKPWTNFLEEKLNRAHAPLEFAVINLGRSGTSTKYIVQSMPENLEKYRPHLVITMMGVNDHNQLDFIHDEGFFSKLKLVRLFRSAENARASAARSHPAVEMIKGPGPLPAELLSELRVHPESAFEIRRMMVNRFMRLGRALEGDQSAKSYSEAFRISQEILSENPHDEEIVNELMMSQSDKALTRKILKGIIRKGFVPSDRILNFLHTISYEEDAELVSLLSQSGIGKFGHTPMEETRRNYLSLIRLCSGKGIAVAVMGYPTTQPELYKAIVTGAELRSWTFFDYLRTLPPVSQETPPGIIFIGNTNFPHEFDRRIYTDFWVRAPEIKVGFGHTTSKGHEMIAENAFKVLSETWLPGLKR